MQAALVWNTSKAVGYPGEEMCISMDTPVCASDRADWGFLHCFNRLGRFHGKIQIIARYLESG